MKIMKVMLGLLVAAALVVPTAVNAQTYETGLRFNQFKFDWTIDSLGSLGLTAARSNKNPYSPSWYIAPGTRFEIWIGVDDYGAWDVGTGDGTDSLTIILQRNAGIKNANHKTNSVGAKIEGAWYDVATVSSTLNDSTDFPIRTVYGTVASDTNSGGIYRLMVIGTQASDSVTADGIGFNVVVSGTGVKER